MYNRNLDQRVLNLMPKMEKEYPNTSQKRNGTQQDNVFNDLFHKFVCMGRSSLLVENRKIR